MNDEDRRIAEAVPVEVRAREGIPDDACVSPRERAHGLALAVLGEYLVPGGLRYSVLGPAWSRDLDAHVLRMPAPEGLRAAGWVSLDPLLRRLGSSAEHRWAITADGLVIGSVDLTTSLRPDPVARTLARARELGRVRVREMLELRALQRAGATLPDGEPIIAEAAALEDTYGGRELARWRGIDPVAGTPWWASKRARVGQMRTRLRPRVAVACSGVDGSGKTTLREQLADDLTAAGIPSRTVWSRPGMGPAWVDTLAQAAKRILGQSAEPGVRAVAEGRGEELRSRHGVVGSLWVLVVTVTFLTDVRRQQRGSGGSVVLWDRHLLDALATLDFVYAGVDLRLARWLVRHFLPRADLTFYLEVSPEVAVARKPGDTLGARAVVGQLEAYARYIDDVPVMRLDGERDPVRNAEIAFRTVVGVDEAKD